MPAVIGTGPFSWNEPAGRRLPSPMSTPDRPSSALPGRLPERPSCPFCGGEETELHSLFGSHASVTTYWCRRCRSPFEYMKWGRQPPADEREGESGREG